MQVIGGVRPALVVIIGVLIGAFIAGGIAATPSFAGGSIQVTTSADNTTTDGQCSLREAIDAANSGAATADCPGAVSGANTITFAAGVTDIALNGTALPDIAATGAITIDGGTGVTIGAQGNSGIFVVDPGTTVTMTDLTLTGGKTDDGSAINNKGTLTIEHSTFSGNSATFEGGAIANDGTLSVTDSTLSANSAGDGGAIFNDSDGALTIANSTFSGNSADGDGGAIDNGGGAMAITNSTFSDNSATGGTGGAVFSEGTVAITNSTFSGNSATGVGGGAILNDDGTVTVTNSIVASSSGDSCFNNNAWSGSNDLSDDSSCTSALGFTQSANINLGPLADNGGPTLTELPLTGSAAIGAGDAATCFDASTVNNTDQRGQPRGITFNNPGYSGSCDIGAVEVQATPYFAGNLVVTTGADTVAPDNACSLREAIDTVQNDATDDPNTDCGPMGTTGTIRFSPLISTVTLAGSELPGINAAVSIEGGTAGVTIDAQGISAIFAVVDGNLTLDHLTLENGDSSDGGAIYDSGGTLNATNSTFSGNTAPGGDGGAIYGFFAALSLTNTTFSGNTASAGGGGAIFSDFGTLTTTNSTFSGNTAPAGDGGAISRDFGVMTITNSTFSSNSASSDGGAIANDAIIATFTNSTFSGNTASAGGGGAIYSDSGTLTITNATISGNSASVDGGAIFNDAGSTLTVTNSIVAGSTSGSNCAGAGTWEAASTNNLSDDTSCPTSAGFSATATPDTGAGGINLGALQDNGGPTETMLPLPGSAAIDAGDEATCELTGAGQVNNLDQRGETRPFDGDGDGTATCDIGAVEIVQSDVGFTLTAHVTGSPTTYGTPVTLSVSGLPAGATGSVTFSDGTTTYCVVTGNSACDSDQTLGAATYSSITAHYSGDATHYAAASANTVNFTVDPASLTITASSPIIAYGDAIPTITPSYAGFIPGEDPSDLATQPTCRTTATGSSTVGQYPTSCNGAASGNYTISYVAGVLTIGHASTTTTVSAGFFLYSSGQIVSLQARVSSSTGITVNEGVVTFADDSGVLCEVAVNNGKAACSATIAPSYGPSHELTAAYSGTANFVASSGTSDAVPYDAQPVIVSMQVLPGEIVIQGAGFSGGHEVTVCGTPVAFTVVNNTVVVASIAGFMGPQQCTVVVVAAGGTASSGTKVTIPPGQPPANPPPGTPTPPPAGHHRL